MDSTPNGRDVYHEVGEMKDLRTCGNGNSDQGGFKILPGLSSEGVSQVRNRQGEPPPSEVRVRYDDETEQFINALTIENTRLRATMERVAELILGDDEDLEEALSLLRASEV
jgi:hypothetical protein